ncbi:hypothetical protein [Novosphingobium sp.]|uniref:hypothetical protein n=1 Tax=Novosphingobium sp. TaxID=1874826 RepID=UPI002FDF4297
MRSIMHALMLTVTVNVAVAAPSVSLAAPAATSAKTKTVYKVDATDLGTLLDDPASKAILIKHIPEVVSNPQIEMGRAMTLSQLAQYAGDQITPEKLAEIQKEFDAAKPS